MERSIDMTEGKPTGLILRLAIPLILTNLGQQMYQIVDAIIVGRSVGVSAFASLGACDWLYWLILWSITALAQGFSAVVAQSFGSGDKKRFRKSVAMCILVSLVFGIILTIITVSSASSLLHLLNTEDAIFDGARTYLTTMYCGTLIILAYNMSGAILRAVGDGKTPLTAMFIAGICNILLDLLFVAFLGWGILGAAGATLLAQLISFLYCLSAIKRNPVFSMEKSDFQPDKAIIWEICRLGIPQALSQCVTVLGGIYAQSVINSFGYIVVAGCTAANKMHTFMDCSANALGYAASTYVGQNYGAGKLKRIRYGMRSGIAIGLVISVFIMAMVALFGRPMVGLFLSSDVTDAAAALDVAYHYVLIMSWWLPTAYLMNLFRYSLQGIGNTLAPMLSGGFEMGARVLVASFLPPLLGQTGLFHMDGAAWAAAGIFQILCFYITLHRLQGKKS